MTSSVSRPAAARRRPRTRNRLRDLIDGLGPSMFVGLLTPQGILIEVNRSGLAAAGLTPADVLGRPFAETYWWAHSAEVQRDLRDAIARAAAGEASRYDVQLRAAHDTLIDVDFSLQPLRDEKGAVAFLVPSSIVITERKRAEAALRRSESEQRTLVAELRAERARLVAAQSVGKVGSWQTDLSTLEVTWSEETHRIFETRPETFRPTHEGFLDLIHPDDRAAVDAAFARSTVEARADCIEHRLLFPDGRIKFVEERWESYADATGRPTRAIGTCQDISARKQTEERLRSREALLQMAGRLSRMGAWSVDLPGLEVTWSDEVCAIHGVPPGCAPTIDEALRFYAPEFREVISTVMGACMRDGTPFDVELQIVTAGGRRVWVRSMGEAERDQAGSIRRVQGSFHDISARKHEADEAKRIADALAASLGEFHALAEAMPQLAWISLPDGWNVYFNPQWMAYTGLTLAQSLGHGWTDAVHPEDLPRAQDARNAPTPVGEAQSLECRLRRADGVYRWWLVRAVPVRDDAGAILRWFGTCTDIHDLKEAARAVSESEQRFATVFQSNLIALDIREMASGRFIDVNDRAGEFFGYSRDEMIGHTSDELRLWIDPAERERLVAKISADGSTVRAEVAFRRKTGETRHALVSMEEMTLPGIKERLVACGILDITERNQLEVQLLQAQKMDAVGRLAGGVAHDFNNSLGVILGYTELLLRQADESQRGKLEQILKATQHATGLTRQLLAFSRKQAVDPKVLDLNALLAGIEKMLGRLIGEHVDVAIVPSPDLGLVKADPGQLEQVVINLCVNARDAMPEGGQLRIETANADLDAAQLATHEPLAPGRYVMLAVSDTGSGIDAATLSKVFEPFFTTKEQGKGTGLGLAMVYGIVQQAGGGVRVSTEIGRGSTFRIYLPRIDEAWAASAIEEAPLPQGGSETILLVEDEAALRAIACEILTEHGYRVIEAGGAAEAMRVASWHEGVIDLLITDVVMPGANGRVLTEALVDARPGLRVLYMSGYTDDVLSDRGVLESGVLLLEKPFTAHALLGRVRDALSGS